MFRNQSITKMSDEQLLCDIKCWKGSADAYRKGAWEKRRLALLEAEADKRGLSIPYVNMVVPSHVKGRLSK